MQQNYFSSVCTNLDDRSIKCVLYTTTQSFYPPRTFQHCRLGPPPECTWVKRAVRELEEEQNRETQRERNKISTTIELNLWNRVVCISCYLPHFLKLIWKIDLVQVIRSPPHRMTKHPANFSRNPSTILKNWPKCLSIFYFILSPVQRLEWITHHEITCCAKLWKSCSMSEARSLCRQLNVPNMLQIICRAKPLNWGSSLRSNVFIVLWREDKSAITNQIEFIWMQKLS